MRFFDGTAMAERVHVELRLRLYAEEIGEDYEVLSGHLRKRSTGCLRHHGVNGTHFGRIFHKQKIYLWAGNIFNDMTFC